MNTKYVKTILLVFIGFLMVTLSSFSDITVSNDPILIRHDKNENDFLKIVEKFDKYVCYINLPDCSGTMVADRWAITAAHCAREIFTTFENGGKHFVIVNDKEIEVDKVILHPSWMKNENGEDDVALLHLKNKPEGAMLAKLYTAEDELDQLVYMVGNGARGNGLTGVQGTDWKKRGATNRIERVDDKWVYWTFDHPDKDTKYLTEYEGISGPGDSGGPAFVLRDEEVYLVGVSSGQDSKGGAEGLYGVEEYYTRISQYVKWINDEISEKETVNNETYIRTPKTDAVDLRPTSIYFDSSKSKQYEGNYQIKETIITVYSIGKKIYFSLPDQPAYEIIPTGENQFTFRLSKEYNIVFENHENGVFNRLLFSQPEGENVGIRKL